MIAIREGSGQGGAHDLRVRAIATGQERPLARGNALVLMNPVTGHKRERHRGALHRQFSYLFKNIQHTTVKTHRCRETDDGAGGAIVGNMITSFRCVVTDQTDILVCLVGVTVEDGPSSRGRQVRDAGLGTRLYCPVHRVSVNVSCDERRNTEGDPRTSWTVPEPLPVAMSQLHCPKQGLFQSLAAWAARGRSAAIRRGLKTMTSPRLVERIVRRERKGRRRRNATQKPERTGRAIEGRRTKGGITGTREETDAILWAVIWAGPWRRALSVPNAPWDRMLSILAERWGQVGCR